MLSTLQALPLDPETGSSTVNHLTQLCTLRFADPSPSGYTIPGQLPSPVSYSTSSQGSTPGTAHSLATASGAPSPSAGRRLEQVAIPLCWNTGPSWEGMQEDGKDALSGFVALIGCNLDTIIRDLSRALVSPVLSR